MGNTVYSQITIIESINESKHVIKCACCSGSGKMSRDHDNRSPYVTCAVCDGKGIVVVDIVNGSSPFIVCKICKGTGEQSRDLDNKSPYIICKKCYGVGARPIVGEMRVLNSI